MSTRNLTKWQIEDWMTTRIAEMLGVPETVVAPDVVFSELGISSLQAVELAAELEDWCGCEIPETFVYECPTIEDAATFVLGLPEMQKT